MAERRNSIGWTANLLFSEGDQAARSAFENVFDDKADYHVQQVGKGAAVQRTDVPDSEKSDSDYHDYSSPPYWQCPYNVLRVRFEPREKLDYMYHRGEEILIPIHGKIMYHSFFAGKNGRPERQLLPRPLGLGNVIRVNPQIPHHTWAVNQQAEAWMIIRDSSDEPSAIVLDPSFGGQRRQPARTVTKSELEMPGRYALIAWGIAEKIRLHRERARLSIEDLARACNIDRALLSRVESADANVSLSILATIATVLKINLDPWPLPQEPWVKSDLRDGPSEPKEYRSLALRQFLYLSYWNWQPNTSTCENAFDTAREGRAFSTWIVLDGCCFFEISDDPRPLAYETLASGSVIHFRKDFPLRITSLKRTQLLRITYSYLGTEQIYDPKDANSKRGVRRHHSASSRKGNLARRIIAEEG